MSNSSLQDIKYYAYHKNKKGSVLINTLSTNQNKSLQKYFDKDISEIKYDDAKTKFKIFEDDGSFTLIIVTSKKRPISQKMIDIYYDILLNVISNIEESTQKIKNDTRRILHNIISLNSINNQVFDSIFSPEDLENLSHKKILDYMGKVITSNHKLTARSILKINKNSNEIKYELDSFKYLMNPNSELRKSKQNIHKVTKRVLDTFFVDFLDANITVNLTTKDNKTIENTLNFDCLRYAIYNLFDNALKYCQKNSTLDVIITDNKTFISIEFSMFSHIINDNEVDKIFLEGFRGKSANLFRTKGDGIGLSMTKNLLNRINASITLQRKEKITDKSIDYQKNIFTITIEV